MSPLLLGALAIAALMLATRPQLAAAPAAIAPGETYGPPPIAATYSQLGELLLLKNATEKDLRVAIGAAERRAEYNPAAFLGIAAGLLTGLITLNPKAGLAAAGAAQQITNAIRGTDDPELRAALQLFESRMGRIAQLEDLYGLPAGVPTDYLRQLMEALGPDQATLTNLARVEAATHTPTAIAAQRLSAQHQNRTNPLGRIE